MSFRFYQPLKIRALEQAGFKLEEYKGAGSYSLPIWKRIVSGPTGAFTNREVNNALRDAGHDPEKDRMQREGRCYQERGHCSCQRGYCCYCGQH